MTDERTAWVAWDPQTRRNVRVPEGTPGATRFYWSESLSRWITIPED
jgi:hypothetical protein